MWGQAPCTTDLSEEVCVIAASTKSSAQCPSNVISIYLHTAVMTPADPLLCFISMWAAVGGAELLRRPKSVWNSAPVLGLWGQWSPGISVEMASSWGQLHPFSPWDRVRDTGMERGRWDLWNMAQQKRKRAFGIHQPWDSGPPPSMAHTRECLVSWAPPWCANANGTFFWHILDIPV